MKVFLKMKRNNISAQGEFDIKTNSLTVIKGSQVSKNIAHTEKFKSANTIEKHRSGNVVDGKLIRDLTFKSASTAANFITGSSTNGLTAWKTEDGKTIREIVKSNMEEK